MNQTNKKSRREKIVEEKILNYLETFDYEMKKNFLRLAEYIKWKSQAGK